MVTTDEGHQALTFEELDRRYYESAGRRLDVELSGLALSFRTYRANAHELLTTVHWFENLFPKAPGLPLA